MRCNSNVDSYSKVSAEAWPGYLLNWQTINQNKSWIETRSQRHIDNLTIANAAQTLKLMFSIGYTFMKVAVPINLYLWKCLEITVHSVAMMKMQMRKKNVYWNFVSMFIYCIGHAMNIYTYMLYVTMIFHGNIKYYKSNFINDEKLNSNCWEAIKIDSFEWKQTLDMLPNWIIQCIPSNIFNNSSQWWFVNGVYVLINNFGQVITLEIGYHHLSQLCTLISFSTRHYWIFYQNW